MERLHKLSAVVIFAFLCLHFANHLIGLEGIDAHMQFMGAVRMIYRQPVVEAIVLAAFAFQIVTGVPLLIEIWRKKKDAVHQLQAASGLVLLAFIAAHVAWIELGRHLLHLDSDFNYIAAGFVMAPAVAYGFYGAGVFALFVHFGGIAFDIYKKQNRAVAWMLLLAVTGLGGYATWLILSIYAGRFYPVHVPEAYLHQFF